eukprot:534157_1
MSNKARTCFRIFLLWNAIRFVTVGVLVRKANIQNESELNKIKDDCCSCYYISQEADQYHIDPNKRFDLSYCMPACTDCNFCNSIKSSFADIDSSDTCKWDNYSQPHSWLGLGIYIFPSLKKETGCTDDNISITSMHIFEKSYRAYGNWALAIGIIYAFAMIILLLCWSDKFEYISLIVFIYNYIIAELDLYWIFKPYQYYRKEIEYTNDEIIECEIDSIDRTAEDILTALLVITFSLLALQIIYCITICCCCFKKCCCKRRVTDSDFNYRPMSVSAEHKRCSCRLNNCFCDWDVIIFYGHIIVGVIVFVLMIFFAGLLMWACYVMITAGNQAEDLENNKLVYIWVVDGLLFFSLWDILLFPFCWKGARFICEFIMHEAGSISRSIN